MFFGEIFAFFAAAAAAAIQFGAWRADAIITNGGSAGKKLIPRNDGDEQAFQPINRDYNLAGYGSNYDRGTSGGLSAIGGKYEGGYEFGYQSGHHDHHHHFHHDQSLGHLNAIGYHHHHHHHRHRHPHGHEEDEEEESDRDDYNYRKSLAIKELLVPLAGVALLGAAAAFVSNPILLQLGVISGSYLGRRKREIGREAINLMGTAYSGIHLEEMKFLKKFVSQVPRREMEVQEKKMMARYLSCSGVTVPDEFCLERLACELHSAEAVLMPMEANVMSIIIGEILGNEFVPEEMKKRISKAIERGKSDGGCELYGCEVLEGKKGWTAENRQQAAGHGSNGEIVS